MIICGFSESSSSIKILVGTGDESLAISSLVVESLGRRDSLVVDSGVKGALFLFN